MNLGALMRTANAFGASFFFTINAHPKVREAYNSDTSRSFDHMPYYPWDSPEAMLLPKGCQLVGVELTDDAIELPRFQHPQAAAYILGIARAVGETMILAVAAGMQPNLTWNPMEPAATITSYIVQVALGDLPHGSLAYQTIFAAGLTLLLITLSFNILGQWLRRRYREAY